MFFREVLGMFISIANGVFTLTQPFIEFLTKVHTIGGVSYSNFELLVGGGLAVVITWGITKWVLGLG